MVRQQRAFAIAIQVLCATCTQCGPRSHVVPARLPQALEVLFDALLGLGLLLVVSRGGRCAKAHLSVGAGAHDQTRAAFAGHLARSPPRCHPRAAGVRLRCCSGARHTLLQVVRATEREATAEDGELLPVCVTVHALTPACAVQLNGARASWSGLLTRAASSGGTASGTDSRRRSSCIRCAVHVAWRVARVAVTAFRRQVACAVLDLRICLLLAVLLVRCCCLAATCRSCVGCPRHRPIVLGDRPVAVAARRSTVLAETVVPRGPRQCLAARNRSRVERGR